MASDTADPRDVIDSMVADASREQSARGIMPTVEDNQAFIAPILEALEKKPKRPHSTTRREQHPQRIADEFSRRHGTEGGDVIITRGGNSLDKRKPGVKMSWPPHIERMAKGRMFILRKSPQWAIRLKQVAALALLGKEQEAKSALFQLLADSNAQFGKWDSKPWKVISHG